MNSLFLHISKAWSALFLLAPALLWLLPALPAHAACSAHVGKVVFNEFKKPTSGTAYVEIKVLDPAVVAATSNFQNWKIKLYAGNVSTVQETDVSSGFTNSAVNSCGQQSMWIRFPDTVLSYLSSSSPPFNFVLYDNAGGQIIDILRVGSTLTSFYGAGSNFSSCTTIESQLPATGTANTQYDTLAPATGASVKDWYRVPDGTGPWTGSDTSNPYNTQCGSNDGGTNPYFGVAKSPNVTTVATNTKFSYTLYATNGGTAVSTPASVVITDNLTAAGLTFDSCTASPGTESGTSSGPTGTCTHFDGTVTWTVGAMAANKVYKVTLTVTAASAGVVTNSIASNVNSPVVSATNAGVTVTTPAGPNHVELVHDGVGLTCTPKAITVLACTSAASCNGVSGNQYSAGTFPIALTAIAGAQWCSDSICSTTLTSPATVSNGTVIYLKDTNVRTDRMAGSASSASNTTIQCTNTTTAAFNATTACDVGVAASGFLVSLPNHRSCSNSTLTVEAVQASPGTGRCVAQFRNQSRSETISFAYTSPATGTLVPSVGGTPISTAGTSVTLAYDNNGTATPAFVYQDAGSLTVTVTDPSLPMTGSATAIIAPASFVFSGIPAAPLVAGSPFNVTVTAKNNCSPAATTQNFAGTVALTSSNPLPALGNATAISQNITVSSGGTASANTTWNEVGTVDLTATTSDYLGSGLSVTSSATTAGRFQPSYFETAVTPGCAGSFTYTGLTGPPAVAGQPFTVEVKAKRFGGDATDGTNTVNYAGATWAKAVTLSDANAGSGTLGNGSFAATDFISGKASSTGVYYAIASQATAPYTLTIRAIDGDTPAVSSSGHAEGNTVTRSGRLRLANANGSELLSLPLTARVEYFQSTSLGWQPSSGDTCTTLTPSNFAFSFPNSASPTNNLYSATAGVCKTAITVSGSPPTPAVILSAPGIGNNGWADLTLNLGATASGNQCAATCTTSCTAIAATTSAKPWLQYDWKGAGAANPTARATFGVFRSGPVIHRRENY